MVARALVLAVLAGCQLGPVPFLCAEDGDCDAVGVTGRCEATGYCSFPDGGCASGRRYATHAPEALSDSCVVSCIDEIALGDAHGCLRKSDGRVWCWGDNQASQLGPGAAGELGPPTEVSGLADVRAIAAGGRHSCAIVGQEGAVFCWGDAALGQTGASAPHADPRQLMSLAGVSALALGEQHSCALVAQGRVACWGSDGAGQLGSDAVSLSSSAPALAERVMQASGVAAGGDSSCAFVLGRAWCWGDNGCGQLGLSGASGYHQPTETLLELSDAPVLGHQHGCGKNAKGDDIACWGSPSSDPCTSMRSEQAKVEGEARPLPRALSAGRGHSCVVSDDGKVACWGAGSKGQLGPSIQVDSGYTAIHVTLPPVRQVAAGGDSSCVLTETGEVWCWGANDRGQLGAIGGALASPAPIDSVGRAIVCP